MKSDIQALTRKLSSKLQAKNPTFKDNIKNLKYDWYKIKNTTSDQADIYIYDEIMPQWLADLFGSGIGAEGMIAQLEEITASTINVRINSPGGAVFEAVAIYNALVCKDATINVYVDALAASAASVIAMAGDKVTMMVGSQLMIHDAMGVEMGNAAELREFAKFLDTQSDNIASIYSARNGLEIAEMRKLMLAETWMNATEAVEMGLADEVYKKPKDAPKEEEAPEEEQPEEEDPEEDAPPEEDGDEEDATEDGVEDLMNRKHSLVNRGFKYAGRGRAPAPANTVDTDKFTDVLANFFGGK
jgi:ATP-dependent protease ClpP protease subunit